MKKLLIGVYHPSVVLTLVGLGCAIGAIAALFMQEVRLSLILYLTAAVCDMFDGAVARMCKRTPKEKEFGIQIDSLCDVCSFVVYPVCLLFFLAGCHVWSILAAVLFAIGGVERLGWFNITTEENAGYFIGMPVTSTAIIIPLAYALLSVLGVTAPVADWIWIGMYGAMALLFVINRRSKKPGKAFRIAMVAGFVLLVAVYIFVL